MGPKCPSQAEMIRFLTYRCSISSGIASNAIGSWRPLEKHNNTTSPLHVIMTSSKLKSRIFIQFHSKDQINHGMQINLMKDANCFSRFARSSLGAYISCRTLGSKNEANYLQRTNQRIGVLFHILIQQSLEAVM